MISLWAGSGVSRGYVSGRGARAPHLLRLVATFVVLVLAQAATAEPPPDAEPPGPISTARPSFSGPATTLDAGYWQWEAGYQYTSNDDGGVDTDSHTLPLLFVRLGLSDRVEVNLTWTGYSNIDSAGVNTDRLSDLVLGASYQVMPDNSAFALATFVNLSVPVGSNDFSSDKVDPGLGIAWSYAASAGPTWFGTVVVNSISDGSERATELGTAIGIAYGLSARVGAYVEYFSVHSDSADSAHNLGGGVTYLINNDAQFDINGGVGLNGDADDYFVGVGLAWRY